MPQEFRAIVSYVRDASTYRNIQDHDGFEKPPELILKSAEFTVLSDGPCPWPPFPLVGKTVRVIVED